MAATDAGPRNAATVVTRDLLFAGPPAPAYPVRRGRGLTAAVVVHALLLLPLVVSVTRYEAQPSSSPAAKGVTFVMAPLHGGSRPPSARPAPDHRASSQSPARSETVGRALSAPIPQLPAESLTMLTSLVPAQTLDVPPGRVSRDVTRGTGSTGSVAAAAPSAASTDSAAGGHGESSPPPAIGAPSGQSNWAGLVLGRLEQFRRYPALARTRRQEGVCYVRFTIDREGHVLASSLDRTSGHALLDREAVALVRRADPLPTPPPELEGDTVTLTVPVEFFLTR